MLKDLTIDFKDPFAIDITRNIIELWWVEVYTGCSDEENLTTIKS